jgi:phosphatidylinositol kinase/protein kinase (PI-3  family)
MLYLSIIDLGIAFDQGRLLSTPELVPFRLTRDIIDGMGSTGVEGAYRRCCEETLKVLRGSSQDLITILDVLRHDPLYQWKSAQLLSKKDQSNNTNAERGLFEITEINTC